jgi:hypothetical protein
LAERDDFSATHGYVRIDKTSGRPNLTVSDQQIDFFHEQTTLPSRAIRKFSYMIDN